MSPYQTVEPSVNDVPLFDWRKYLPVHPLAEAYPNLPQERLVALGQNIKNNGLQFPIVVHAKGSPGNPDVFELIDGVRRLDALVAVGIKFEFERFRFHSKRDHSLRLVIHDIADAGVTTKVVHNWVDDEIAAYIESANLHRRHLEPEQYRAHIEASHARIKAALERDGEKSDRALAAELGVGKDTIRRVRATGAPAPVEGKRIGKDGIARKARGRKPGASPGFDAACAWAKRLGCEVEELASGGFRLRSSPDAAPVCYHSLKRLNEALKEIEEDQRKAETASDVDQKETEKFEVEHPEQIKKNLLDTIDQSCAVVRAYKKILKVSLPFDQEGKDEVMAAIGKLLITWQSLQASLAPRPAGNGGAPVAGSDHPIPDDLSIPGFLNRTPTESTRG
jgi:hypothetical protein